MVVKKKTRCKICNHEEAHPIIDSKLAQKVSYKNIIEWANDFYPELSLTKKNLWSHNTNHRIPALEEFKDPTIPKPKEVKNVKTEALRHINDLNLLTLDQFLDLVIAKATKGIVDGDITPNVSEAVKAAEIKDRIKKGSPFEESLLKFFKTVSSNHEITND